MKVKIFGLTLMLCLAAVLGACQQETQTDTTTPTDGASPATGEPADGAASPSPTP
jgi:major membrane immunogen (membrane-anchored lipoprotein)